MLKEVLLKVTADFGDCGRFRGILNLFTGRRHSAEGYALRRQKRSLAIGEEEI